MTVKQTNPNWLEKLMKQNAKAAKLVVAVGYPVNSEGASARYPDTGVEVLDVAVWNNFGTEEIPRRDFMSLGAKNANNVLAPIIKKQVPKMNDGTLSARTALEQQGLKAAIEFRKAIVNISTPPNAQSTIDAKGSSNPLVNEGTLGGFLSHDVRKGRV